MADHSQAKREAVDMTSSSPATDANAPGEAVVMMPRYIPLPEVLSNLHKRFPSVLECVCLECTRCHQWVTEDVRTGIPDEIREAPVASHSAAAASSSSLSPFLLPKSAPKDEEATQSVDTTTPAAPITWHSERLRHKSEEAMKQLQEQERQRQREAQKLERRKQKLASSSDSAVALLALVRRQSPVPSSRLENATWTSLSSSAKRDPSTAVTRFMPNPATFVCRWACCAAGDRLRDLQSGWTGEVLKMAEALAAARGTAETDTDRSDDAHPRPTASERKAESGAMSSRASPHIAAATSPVATASAVSSVSALAPPDLKERRDALNEALEKELELRRSSRLAQRRAATDHSTRGSSTDALLQLLTAPTAAPQSPTSAAAGTVVAASASASGAGDVHARRQHWLHHAWVQSAAGYLVQTDLAATLSAFCWVVCEACGKVRRIAQPFPGGAPFVCALSPTSGGRCDVSEMDGFVACTQALLAAQVVEAAQLSPFVPVVPPYKVAGPAADEPILQSVCAVVEAERGGSPLTSQTRVDALIAQCVPLLRDLTAAIRKRSTGSWAKQLAMTPAEIRRKREDVLRQVFLRAEERAAAKAVAEHKTHSKSHNNNRKNNKSNNKSSAMGGPESATAPAPARRGRKSHATPEAPEVAPRRKRGRSTEGKGDDSRAVIVVDSQSSHSTISTSPATATAGTQETVTTSDVSQTTTATPPPLAQSGVKRGRGRPRKQPLVDTPSPAAPRPSAALEKPVKGGDAVDEDEDEAEEEEEIIHWVQCDTCSKWRIIPEPIADTVAFWTCSMRVDPVTGHRTSCREMDDEKKMARQGRQVREV